ncbi:hypothetical protein ABE096_22110 [Robertmurraya massiliosenegalensis]|uniref:hypothetical protein n=1 Tax=Robertmurraya TaxID=2837507 RepID=UPI0039A50C1A
MEKVFEQLYLQYANLFAEILKVQETLEIMAESQGIDIDAPKEELENNFTYIDGLKEKNNNLEPIHFKSILDDTYKNTIRANIVNIVERNIPTHITDINERIKYKEELIREWSDLIVEVTGHGRRSAQEVFKGNQDINADVILIMEKVIPQIDRDDILGRREKTNVYESEFVLEKLRKQISKDKTLAVDIEKILNTLLRFLNKVDDKYIGDIAELVIPCLEDCFDKLKMNNGS